MSVASDALFVVFFTAPLAGAWFLWRCRDKSSLSPLRRRAMTVGLAASSVSAICLAGALVHSILLGGFTEHRRLFDLWSGPGLIACAIGVLMLSFGNGLSRLLGWVSSVIILAMWMLSMMAN